jgi:hypothetical protein
LPASAGGNPARREVEGIVDEKIAEAKEDLGRAIFADFSLRWCVLLGYLRSGGFLRVLESPRSAVCAAVFSKEREIEYSRPAKRC